MSIEARTLLRWSDCDLNESFILPPPPEFFVEPHEDDTEFVTSTQVSFGQDLSNIESPVKKKACLEKLSKKEALDFLSDVSKKTEAAQKILEALANRTFSNISEDDLTDLKKAQYKLSRKLGRLSEEIKTRSFRRLQSQVQSFEFLARRLNKKVILGSVSVWLILISLQI